MAEKDFPEMYNDYAKDIEIDENDLVGEWLDHGNRVYHYNKLSANANDERDRAKEKLTVIESELLLKVKSDPEKFIQNIAVNKISEATYSAWIKTQPEYKEALEDYLKKKHNSGILGGAVNVFDSHRKYALSNLVNMLLAGFFSVPRVKNEFKKEVEEDFRKVQLEGLKDMGTQLKTLKRKKKNEGPD